ncbi:MAG: hypothetical protein AB2385_15345 [Symbiobacterium sp.]|uniref:hypothetical protein n=1 Tax=Symbiobacterium sp. TaxID=1971213 RepID=UPI0034639871
MGNRPDADRLIRVLGFDPAEALDPGPGTDLAAPVPGPAEHTWAGEPAGSVPVPEDGDELAALAEALQAAARAQDAAWPDPDPAETRRLVAALTALVPAPESPFAAELERTWVRQPGWLARTLAAVQPQVRLLERPFWLASAALVAAGMPLLSPDVAASLGLDLTYGAFLLLVAPILATLGVAHAFRGISTGMAEVELTCALTPAQLVLGRLFWVAAYDTLLLGGASLLSAALEPSVMLGWLVLGWLLPILVLSVTVLSLSLYVPPWVGGSAALALWLLILTRLTLARDLPIAAVTDPVVLLPLSAFCAGGLILAAGLIARTWPRLTTRLAGLDTWGRRF